MPPATPAGGCVPDRQPPSSYSLPAGLHGGALVGGGGRAAAIRCCSKGMLWYPRQAVDAHPHCTGEGEKGDERNPEAPASWGGF